MSSVLRTNLGLLVLANFVPFSAKNHITITTVREDLHHART